MSLKSLVEKVPFYNEVVKPWHLVQAMMASAKYDFPAKKLRVIGVTGTNGKTTTCFMIWKMLNEAGRKAGLLTTVAWGGVGGDETDVVDEGEDARHLHRQFEHMTTERVEVLNQRMRAVADAKAEFLVLEVTSHALSQFRTWGVPVEIAVFTNLAHEHLDYHKTMERYRAAKLKLFRGAEYGVINADDENAGYFEAVLGSGHYSSYGIKNGEIRATGVKLGKNGVNYACGDIKGISDYSSGDMKSAGDYASGDMKVLRIRTQIPGIFNVYNSLAAVAVGLKVGLTGEQIERGIAALTAVEGRMTRVQEGQDFEVIVDYAHVPDALEKVFRSVKPAAGGRIIAVHGGAGRRDASTRAMRGEILGRESDVVIITEDDSRDEDPQKIAAQFVEGAEKAGKRKGEDLFVELDRRKAIEKAIEMARKGDVVLILGKGHEKTILRAEGAVPFEDIEVAREALKKR